MQTDDKPKPQFFRVGSSVVKEGAVKAMTVVDLKVYLVLALHANWVTGKCWPSYTTIRTLSGCARGSISDAIQRLTFLGAISYRKEKATRGLRNVYTVFRTLRAPSGTESSHTDDPPSKKNRNDLGHFQSSHTDGTRSSQTDDPQSSHTDQNEIHLNESNRTRSKEVNPPAPIQGSGRAPEAVARPSLTISEGTLREILKTKSREDVIGMLKKGNHPIPAWLLTEARKS